MNLAHDIAQLPTLTVTQLRQRYADLFGEITQVGNKQWLVKRIAWLASPGRRRPLRACT